MTGWRPPMISSSPVSVNSGRDVAAVGGELREGGEDVHLGDGRGGSAEANGLRGDGVADFDEELLFDFADAFVGGEDFAFVLFQFGSGEALGVDQRLFALVVGGREMQIRLSRFRCSSRRRC